MANAACYTMSLADLLSGEGHPPAELATDARVHLEEGETNWSITRIELHTVGKVDGVDAAEFERPARRPRRPARCRARSREPEISLVAELAQ